SYTVGDELLADIRFISSACDTILVPVSLTVTNDIRNEITSGLPRVYSLHQNYPNPFNPTTEIRFDLPAAGMVRLEVFNVLGQKIATLVNQPLQPGYHTVRFQATEMPAGVYFYRMEAGAFQAMEKMILMK
ncbi:MAG: T9SS type A sorting domain-containing protein, partial [bacterium]|nr:T9SS type A sorting domain-containing protein [bacterium]